MEQFDNYQKEKLTISEVKANILAVLFIFPIFIAYSLPYYLIWKDNISIDKLKIIIQNLKFNIIGYGLFFLLTLIFGIVLHELIHGITWAKFTKHGFKSIKFGILLKMLTPYCHCKEPLMVKQYILGAIMPAIILGFIPALYAIIFGNFYLLIFGLFFTFAAGGDFLIVNLLRKEKMTDFVQDHPSEVGCYIFRNPNI